MSAILELKLSVMVDCFLLEEGVFVVATYFPEQILLLGLLVLQIPKAFIDVFLKDIEPVYQLLIFSIEF